MKELLVIAIITTVVISGLVGFGNLMTKHQCEATAEAMGLPHNYSFMAGCLVRVEKKIQDVGDRWHMESRWFPIENVRSIE